MSVFCECCVLSGRDLCVGLITRREESYGLWCVIVCDSEALIMTVPWPTGCRGGGCCEENSAIKNMAKCRPVMLNLTNLTYSEIVFNPLKAKRTCVYIRIQSVPRCKHSQPWL